MSADPADGRCGACRDLGVLHTYMGDCQYKVRFTGGDVKEDPTLKPTTEGIAAIPDHMRELQPILEEVRTVMYERGRKYGPGNIAEFGELGVLVRLSDKLARLRNSKDDFSDESVADTWLDVVGYGLIGLMIQKGLWPK